MWLLIHTEIWLKPCLWGAFVWQLIEARYFSNSPYISMSWVFPGKVLSMMTSSNGNIFRVTGHLCGEFTGLRWIPRTKASDAELWCFLDVRLIKRQSKHSRGWWFETLSHPLWRHRNACECHRTHGFNIIQAMALCLSRCWPRSLLSYAATKPRWANSLRTSDAFMRQ